MKTDRKKEKMTGSIVSGIYVIWRSEGEKDSYKELSNDEEITKMELSNGKEIELKT